MGVRDALFREPIERGARESAEHVAQVTIRNQIENLTINQADNLAKPKPGWFSGLFNNHGGKILGVGTAGAYGIGDFFDDGKINFSLLRDFFKELPVIKQIIQAAEFIGEWFLPAVLFIGFIILVRLFQ